MNKFIIKPRKRFRWFGQKQRIVYDIHERVSVWKDPSHGNGGGDWEQCLRFFATYDNVLDAQSNCDKFNKLWRDSNEGCSCN